jgi:hypothetical protein
MRKWNLSQAIASAKAWTSLTPTAAGFLYQHVHAINSKDAEAVLKVTGSPLTLKIFAEITEKIVKQQLV